MERSMFHAENNYTTAYRNAIARSAVAKAQDQWDLWCHAVAGLSEETKRILKGMDSVSDKETILCNVLDVEQGNNTLMGLANGTNSTHYVNRIRNEAATKKHAEEWDRAEALLELLGGEAQNLINVMPREPKLEILGLICYVHTTNELYPFLGNVLELVINGE